MKRYAAYDEAGIWAVGDTPQQAINAFERDTQSTPDEYGILYTAPMTDRLAEKVEREGFDCNRDSYSWTNGMLDYNPNDRA